MAAWLQAIVAISLVALPGLIIYYIVKEILGKYFDAQHHMKQLEMKSEGRQATLPMKLQAYERLALFCERIKVPNLIARHREEGLNVEALKVRMMIAIKQEYEHNTTQQIYVSNQLWKIVDFATKETLSLINGVAMTRNFESTIDYSRALLTALGESEIQPLDKALEAIKEEVQAFL